MPGRIAQRFIELAPNVEAQQSVCGAKPTVFPSEGARYLVVSQ
jgi:hypothetical protein